MGNRIEDSRTVRFGHLQQDYCRGLYNPEDIKVGNITLEEMPCRPVNQKCLLHKQKKDQNCLS